MEKTTKLSGLDDPRLNLGWRWPFEFSGRSAYHRTSKLLSRVTPKRFEEFLTLVNHVKFFGGMIEFVHKEDFTEEEVEVEFVYAKKDKESTVLGSYREGDHWITLPVDTHNGWGTVEETLRHELIHLLQDVVTPFGEGPGRPLGLITDHVSWGSGIALAVRDFYNSQEDPSDNPVHEIEAHWLDTWVKCVEDWAGEIEKSSTWHNNWRCPVHL
jgi:hypothetical protein